MSLTAVLWPSADPSATDDDDQGITHVMCCADEDLGLCGSDLTHMAVDEGAETTCVVCDDLDGDDPCAVCPLSRGGAR